MVPSQRYVFTAHATVQMLRRGISEAIVRRVLELPEQRTLIRPGRVVYQSRVEFEGKPYLVRVVVDVDRSPPEVVTVYRTSRISKYWREG